MKILITGGTGFIGRNLKEQLTGEYQIEAPGSKELDLLDANKVRAYLKQNRFDVVIHAAVWNATRNSTKDTSLVLNSNRGMFLNLSRCSDSYGKLFTFGSGAEFDREHWIPRMNEAYFGKHIPGDSYGLSKYLINNELEQSKNIYNLRLFGVFGKYEDWEIRFISNACCKALFDLPITIKQNVFFDYLFIDDLVKIVDWFMQNQTKEKVYNICTGRTHDLLTLARKILRVSGKNLDIKVAEPGLKAEYSGDNSRLINEIGHFQFKDMDTCLGDLYNWYRVNQGKIDRSLLLYDK
ncbi:MAG: NAD(P)-dependent oxidoreductase [Candidatus Omnitrophica bacterium]|nr:NAD(P)-dependent oxidoreductase [Candidatus Omnitrophota bacterium]